MTTIETNSQGKVWAVARGKYDEYSVVCVCATKEIADHAADAINAECGWAEATVEAITYLTEDTKKVKGLSKGARVDSQGNVEQETEVNREGWTHDGWGEPVSSVSPCGDTATLWVSGEPKWVRGEYERRLQELTV